LSARADLLVLCSAIKLNWTAHLTFNPFNLCVHCSDVTLLNGRSTTVDDTYSDRGQLCRGDVTAPVIRQELCATDEACCVSLCTVDNRQLSLDRISRDHPAQSTWISWIDWKQPISRGGVVIPDDWTLHEEMTELKVVGALDERRHFSAGEQEYREVESQVTDCSTSQCGEVASRTDSGFSSLTEMLTLSREEDGKCDNSTTLKSVASLGLLLPGAATQAVTHIFS